MFTRHLFFFGFIIYNSIVFAQSRQYSDTQNSPAIGKIKGTVLDNKTQQPVEFATITLFSLKDSSLVTGAVADGKGAFELSSLNFGLYFMKINFIGYKQLVIDTLKIRPKNPQLILENIKLKSNAEQLDAVEVSGEKSIIQLGIDKKIFNVEKNIVSEGGSASDVLQSIPSVSVDIDGNISLRGSGNVAVLVDGKPSGITGSSRAAILQQIPASSIESIELITNPSAKYDPDGMSGIINIVLKKNKLSGFNGSVSAGVGTGEKYNASANVSYRNSRINAYANYGFRINNRTGSGYSNRQNIFQDTTYFLTQESSSKNKNTSHTIKGGVDFFLNDKNTIGISVLYAAGKENGTNLSTYTEADNTNLTSATYIRDETSGDIPTSTDYTINYRKTFAKPKQDLTIDGTYSASDGNDFEDYSERDYTLKYNSKNTAPLKQKTTTKSSNSITTLQSDYTQPFKNQMKMEAGIKAVLRSISTDFISSTYNYSIPDFVLDTVLSNDFRYNENIYAAYLTYSGILKKIGYQVGLRAEEANTVSNSVTINSKNSNNYFSFFPTVHISKKFSKDQEMQISYSRRINRPSMRTLNPFRDVADPYNIRYGNPFLKPEYINAYELTYVKYWGKAVLTATAYYRQTTGIIQRIKTVADTLVAYTTFVNLNSSTSYGFELIAKNDITKWWSTTTSANVFQTIIDGKNVDADMQNNNVSFILKLISNMHIWKNMDIQITANYMGPTATAQGEVKPIFTIDLGLKKEIFKNASLSLNLNDLTDSRKMDMKATGTNFNQTMERKRESRVATISFTYRFGKASESTKKGKQNKVGNGDFDGGGGDMGM